MHLILLCFSKVFTYATLFRSRGHEGAELSGQVGRGFGPWLWCVLAEWYGVWRRGGRANFLRIRVVKSLASASDIGFGGGWKFSWPWRASSADGLGAACGLGEPVELGLGGAQPTFVIFRQRRIARSQTRCNIVACTF